MFETLIGDFLSRQHSAGTLQGGQVRLGVADSTMLAPTQRQLIAEANRSTTWFHCDWIVHLCRCG
jgi:hypothetical protein